MHLRIFALTLTLLTPQATRANADRFAPCLPEGIKGTSVILDQSRDSTNSKAKPKTLEAKLLELKAQCKNGKLVARNGKEIRIVQLIGCWGNPPDDYQEQLNHQQDELKELRQKYVVIEIPCPSDKTIARLTLKLLMCSFC